jgi:hypothetical protein
VNQEKEYFAQFPNLTLIPFLIWAVMIGLTLAGVFYASKALAEPRLLAVDNGVAITLYDDPCELKGEITNLPYKATWTENGKTFEGCWAGRDDVKQVMAYFTDKTVALIPYSVFKRAIGA